MAEAEVLIETQGSLGLITLNRPKALNALSTGMVASIDAALARFATQPEIGAVLIQGAGERAFCAGGDVRAITPKDNPAEAARLARIFFDTEYRMNYRIHTYPKPFIALLDGVTMGGGCGVSLHGRFRVTTERTVLAMPETALGLFPDVGATWFLNQAPGEAGLYLGLTGARLKAADVLAFGLGTHHVASAGLAALVTELGAAPHLNHDSVEQILRQHHVDPGPTVLAAHQAEIDAAFGLDAIEAILDALSARQDDWAEAALGAMRRASPASLKLTLRQLRGGRALPFRDSLAIEFRLALRRTRSIDFAEGVRSILVDRDNDPHWQPATLDAVSDESIEALFLPLPSGEPELDLATL